HPVSALSRRCLQSRNTECRNDRTLCDWTGFPDGCPFRTPMQAEERSKRIVSSIYHRVLGSDFKRLHPKIQERFGFSSTDLVASMGRAVTHDICYGRLYTLPFLYLGSWRNIMFPERARQVPFSIENYAFLDPLGRETVTWIRRFATPRPRRFDAYMIYSK